MSSLQVNELELLAPARNCEIGIAAIDCGADAVYIAGPRFGARQAAGNGMEDIARLCSYAHRFGSRIFVTFNTILFDDEIQDAREMLSEIQETGADAVIVQDLAVMKMAREMAGDRFSLPLHASTQCAIRTPEQARFYEDLGFSRLILERELSLEQIRKIRDAVSCELEFFVHGALCVCYSGQCYMSEAISGRSANRGACIQACRSLYDLTDQDGNTVVRNKALLSLKDYNLKDRIGDLAAAGISSFKIEGRLKNISYVKNIVRDYSEAIDRIVSASGESGCSKYVRASFGKVSGGFTPSPDKTFNRGYTGLFIDGRRGRWSTFDSAKGMGEEIGTVASMSQAKDRIIIRPAARYSGTSGLKLNNGDGLSFVARNSEVTGFRADVCNGMEVSCKPVPGLFIGARIFRNMDIAFEKELEKRMPVREIQVDLDMYASYGPDGGFTIRTRAVSEDGRTYETVSEAGSQAAENRARMETMFASQMSKGCGHYRFRLTSLEGDMLPFLPASSINAIRRDIAAGLDSMPCSPRPLTNRTCTVQNSHADLHGMAMTYKANISNSIAESMYLAAGASGTEKAFELTHRSGAELMRTRYCIRHELGICPKQKKGQEGKAPAARQLFLSNNGRRFPLVFDCARCEMAVMSPDWEPDHNA